MCQLLGMSCKEPANINFSFAGFRARGGLTDEHKDGWGLAFYRNNRFDVYLDHEPAAKSALAAEINSADIKSKTIIAHIRKATVGEVKLTNCHPFQRELWGKTWLFCHNGHLKNFSPELNGRFNAQGDTDSELAFCYVLQRLEQEFPVREPSTAELFHALDVFAREIESFGIFNIILSLFKRNHAFIVIEMEVVHLLMLSQLVASFAKVQVGETLQEDWLILIRLI